MRLALLLSRSISKHPSPSIWWSLRREGRNGVPSYPQAPLRGTRLLARLEAPATPAKPCAEVVIDAMPLPICRPRRGKRCAFPGAPWGFGTQGQVSGDKLHAWRRGVPSRWVSTTGNVLHHLVRPANVHDATLGHELNRRWPEFGGLKIVEDNGECGPGFIFPPEKNTR